MIDLSKVKGLADDVKGAIKQIADAAGNVLWSAASWPDDLYTGLEFTSTRAFTMSVASPNWDGTMEYCNGGEWQTWDGSEISSGKSDKGYCIYIRGIGNTKVTGNATNSTNTWTLAGAGIKCNGNIENLLDYSTANAGLHPTMAQYCYGNMFRDCTALKSGPSLPATTLVKGCYRSMFEGCTALTSVPKLPATTLVSECYYYMFNGCKTIKLSKTKTGSYTKEYRIPYSGTGTSVSLAMSGMFYSTGGTALKYAPPEINTTYYLISSNTIV